MFAGEAAAGRGIALFRPADTRLDAGANAEGLPVRITEIQGRGAVRLVSCQALSGDRFTAELAEPAAGAFEIGQKARLSARRVVLGAGGASALATAPTSTPSRLGAAGAY